jgi:acyl-homoserine-lactone acylase
MKKLILFFVFAIALQPGSSASTDWQNSDLQRWERRARNVTIIRDDWGIAHVYGKTDADAVFGAIYAQAEDDFNRVETNYINAMGRLAEAEGESAVWRDLRMGRRSEFLSREAPQDATESDQALRTLDGALFH